MLTLPARPSVLNCWRRGHKERALITRKEETTPKSKKTVNAFERTGARSSQSRSGGSKRQSSVPTSSRAGGRLQLPPGEPDLEALRSVTREWLVPRLVEKFLRIHGIELKHSRKGTNTANRLQISLPEEGSLIFASAGAKEIRPQANKKNQYRVPR
jgi:hypothetical protein